MKIKRRLIWEADKINFLSFQYEKKNDTTHSHFVEFSVSNETVFTIDVESLTKLIEAACDARDFLGLPAAQKDKY